MARTPDGTWVVLGHAEAREVALDHGRFSSAVSRFLQIPNGLDGEEHRAFRAIIDPYFAPAEMAALEPLLRQIACELLAELTVGAGDEGIELDAVSQIGAVFAVRAQIRWLGWLPSLESRLLAWMESNHAASRSGQLARTAEVAEQFDAIIRSELDRRRDRTASASASACAGVTSRLMRERVRVPDTAVPGAADRALSDEELISILRNWTGGDLGSIALCIGVLLVALARMPELAERVRTGSYDEVSAITDELLRIDDPFVSNRRRTTCPVTLAGHRIGAGERVQIHWTSANRDEREFGDPDTLAPEANAPANLVYGVGRHACPGRPLATLELVVALQEILADFEVRAAGTGAEREVAPVGGWAHAPVLLIPRA